MDYPIYLNGRPCGTLCERRDGLYTVFSADCPRQAGFVRLWVHGGGQSALLGLLAPRGARMGLTRRLTRRERAALPAVIERVSDEAGAAPPRPPERPRRAEPAAPETDWKKLPDGSLLGPGGALALPADLSPGSRPGTQLMRLGGREYLVFRLPPRYNKKKDRN